MKIRTLFNHSLSLFCCLLLSNGNATPTSDLTFVFQQILENHPGIYNDTIDPTFCTRVTTSYAIHKAALNNNGDDKALTTSFVRSIGDPYLRAIWNDLNTQEVAVNEAKQLSVTMLTDTIAWINLPTFLNFSDQQRADWEHIHDQLPSLAHDHTIIFDLRNNRGGNSYFAQELIKSLVTPTYYQYYTDQAKAHNLAQWRASRENIKHFKKRLKNMPSLQQEQYQTIINGMKEACKNKSVYFTEAHDVHETEIPAPLPSITSQIVVIINESTYSSALFFLDSLKMMTPSVVVIGKESAADGLYIDARSIDLPSGNGIMRLPTKMYYNSFHPGSQPHTPDIIYLGDISDTPILQTFVLEQIGA